MRLAYCVSCSQLLDTLQVCRDFKYGQCVRPACKFVHLLEVFSFLHHACNVHGQSEALAAVLGRVMARRPCGHTEHKAVESTNTELAIPVHGDSQTEAVSVRRRGCGAWPGFSLTPPVFADHVEVTDMKVSVCRDAVKGKCGRGLCKYYHLPVLLPPAPLDPHSARTHSAPRHHTLHNPPTHTLVLDNAYYLEANNNNINISGSSAGGAAASPTPLAAAAAAAAASSSNGNGELAGPSALQVIAGLAAPNNIILKQTLDCCANTTKSRASEAPTSGLGGHAPRRLSVPPPPGTEGSRPGTHPPWPRPIVSSRGASVTEVARAGAPPPRHAGPLPRQRCSEKLG
ncbi:hypothetical protein GWK47_001265 [Chionoecetes opilio]|uniref:C3H1-type domain-containing protein n=1 Tax=Chionoecetes opilio TaxID=41210 RepID=A0A8J4XXU3_CHIOP|nr:hypothetical protein GWK47_001265 [Chionoecetes opilio]